MRNFLMNESKDPNLHAMTLGDNCLQLIPASVNDAEKIVDAMMNGPPVTNLSYFSDRSNLERDSLITDERQYLERIVNDPTSYLFLVYAGDAGSNGPIKLVGTIGLHEHDTHNDTARPGIMIFPVFQRKGYGSQSLSLLLQFAFMALNVNLIYLVVFPENKPAVKLYKSFRFIEEGILRQRYKLDGEYHNMLSMSLTKDDWMRTE